MNRALLCFVAAPLLAGCATDPYGHSDVGTRTGIGAAVGGAVGALAGQAVGLDPVAGAAAGMVVGGAAGYAAKGTAHRNKKYYRDTRGYCYYVDAAGVSHYDDPPVKC